MRILAIETTERIGGVAAWRDDKLLDQLDLNRQQRSAQSLAPGIESLLRQVGWEPQEVDLVAVTSGPGSFTGLRVGVATAKAFAYAVKAEVLGVDTLETIANQAPDDNRAVSAAVDAQRREVVARSFRRAPDGWFRPIGAAELIDARAWMEGLAAGDVISGPVLRGLADRVPAHLTVLDPECWGPKAATVARLAARDFASGRRDDLWSLGPCYSRRSAAEEKYSARDT